MKNIFDTLILSILIIIFILYGCSKEENCSIQSCNFGTINNIECKCICPEGVIGLNCDKFDQTKIQDLLDTGYSPQTLFNGGISTDSLMGKIYKGGYIFYLNTSNGFGLIAALQDQSSGIDWGCAFTDISDLTNVIQSPPVQGEESEIGARIGDGKSNTLKIINECTENKFAAKKCHEYQDSSGGEWFLPSRAELYLLRKNLKTKGLGNFSNYKYWSSTEYDKSNAWSQDFASLATSVDAKTADNWVRAIKSFTSNCVLKDCNFGTLNESDCSCNCPEGFLGKNCEILNLSKTQLLLDKWKYKPIELYNKGIPLDSIYGKKYEGGLIFYLNLTDGSGLIAAEQDQSNNAEWGCGISNLNSIMDVSSYPPKNGPDTIKHARIGDGKLNTQMIITECKDDNIAAKICYDLVLNGYSDWFLPSRGELSEMFLNLNERGLGNFNKTNYFYWSSTEHSNSNAWIVGFDVKDSGPVSKSTQQNVRAARSF